MQKLSKFLREQITLGKTIYPPGNQIFNAFNKTPFPKVKVVILGQDPYHGESQAHGLSFSVRPGVRVPPSLQNIYKELQSDLGIKPAQHGYLENWAKEGVLMLNNVLTVEKSKAGSHQNKGWEHFTDKVVEILNEQKENLVFLLWGAHAQRKGEKLNRERHLVLESPHPSPFSAHRGFLGNKHFSKVNLYLDKMGLKKVDWSLPEHVSDHI